MRFPYGTLFTLAVSTSFLIAPAAAATTGGKRALSHGARELSFEPNQGQTAPEVRYLSHGKRSSLFLTANKAVLLLRRGDRQLALEMRLKGANADPRIEGTDPLPGTVNYFSGGDARKWRTGIPRFGRVLYRSVYPGIDLAYYGTERQLEYDFVVAPGADPGRIAMEVAGHDRASIDAQGDLVLMAEGHEMRQHKPVVYQVHDGRRERVDGRYVLRGSTVTFALGPYDRSRALVIDPLFGYSTYLGGNKEEDGTGVATDAECNLYMTGTTPSVNFPTTPGAFRVSVPKSTQTYVAKIDPDSETLIYSTFLGGDSSTVSTGIVVDAAGNAYITGTQAGNFPTTAGAPGTSNDGRAFVAKLNPSGTQLLYGTTVPGTISGTPNAIAIDRNGAAYITGTVTAGLKTTAGAYQPTYPSPVDHTGFLAKVNPDGKSLGYVTYFGVTKVNVDPTSLAVDASGTVYFTGYTRALDLPVTANAPQPKNAGIEDAFLFKLNSTGSAILFGTYLGGVGYDRSQGVALDGAGNIYMAGLTTSGAFPTTPGAYRATETNFSGSGWVVKYSATDYKILYSTYVARVSGLNALAVDSAGNAYTTGEANSTSDLRTTADAIKSKVVVNVDGQDSWVAKLNPSGTGLLYGTYFGGTADETSAAIAIDSDSSIYITGNTFSTDLPMALHPAQGAHSDGGKTRDSYVTQFVEPPWFDAAHIANAASFRGGAIAHGEIVTIYGFSLGPKKLRTYNLTNGKFDTTLARTRVLFDGVEAPIIYASWGQTSIVVPYSVAGKQTTQAVFEYKGRRSAPVTLTVADAAPGIFTIAQNGSGQGAILNWPDYTVNGPNSRIAPGGLLMVFLTVGGENGKDGEPAQGIQQHPMIVTARVGGVDAQVTYAGPSPGLIWGLTQVNVIVPTSVAAGAAVPITVTFGNRTTQADVTIAVK